jgi:hypothetical protein
MNPMNEFYGNEDSLDAPDSTENIGPTSPFLNQAELQWNPIGYEAPMDGSAVDMNNKHSSGDPVGFDLGAEIKSAEEWQAEADAWEAEKKRLEEKIADLEEQLEMEREHRIWRERQFCVTDSELERALEKCTELQQFNANLEHSLSESRAELDRAYARAQELDNLQAGASRTARTASLEVDRLTAELDNRAREAAHAFAESERLKSQVSQAHNYSNASNVRLAELQARISKQEEDYKYLINNLGLAVYVLSENSPSNVLEEQGIVLGGPNQPARVLAKPKSKRWKKLIWCYNTLFPHMILVSTTFLLSVGTGPEVLAELIGGTGVQLPNFPS